MAEKVHSNIVEGILNSLNGLTAIEGLNNLRDTVSAIKPSLLRAEEQLAPNHEVDHWLRKLNDVIYDADDLLDAAFTEALRQGLMTQDGWMKKVRTFLFKTHQFALGGKMSSKIKEIESKLDVIKAGIETLQIEERPVRPQNNYRTELSTLEWHMTIVGREKDITAIVQGLNHFNVEGNISFHTIVGLGGMGKTILAKVIFDRTTSFDLKMWVSVGDNFDIKIIVKKLLESASRNIGEIRKLDELKHEFRNAIVGRKFFLVLDNVWNEDGEKWCELQNLLMGGARGSKILITTRSYKVARLMHPSEPYYLGHLDDRDAWELFKEQLTLEAGKRLWNSSFCEMLKHITQRCAGRPLITKMVASSFLYFENSEPGQRDFMEKLLELSQDKYDDSLILKFCYNMLPSHLKCCFAYCSLFPKGHTICKMKLIKLWIAQGFVKSQENLCLEDVGHGYFMDLLRGHFFHEPSYDMFDNIISCKMHDLLHELATSMAGLLITIPEKRKINERTRHVGFMNFSPAMPSMLNRVRSIRTFLYSNFSNFEGECDCKTIFSRFKLLRVLDLNYRDLTNVPSSISKLEHLRYIDLSYNKDIIKLPKSITSLLNLQTIRLSGCWSLKELPRDIKRLVNLRHLELDDCWKLKYMPRGLGQLTNLQILTLFVVDSGSLSKYCAELNELSGLKSLRGKLVVRDSHAKRVVSKHQATNLKEKITSLYLKCCDDNKSLERLEPQPNLKQLLIEEYWDLRFSRWIFSLTSLVELKLLYCKKCQCLPRLSQLYSLKCLWLEEMGDIQYVSECGDQNELSSSLSTPIEICPALETIYISNCPKLMGWWRDSSMEVSGGSHSSEHRLLTFFPHLSSLHVRKCPLLTSMPMGPDLGTLYIEDANWKPLLQTLMTACAASSLSRWHRRTMTLASITEVETLLEEWLQNFSCLWSMMIKHCDLKSLTMEHCDKLESLTIKHCAELDSLTMAHCDKLESLKMKHCVELKSMSIKHCDQLKSLMMKHSHKLENLTIQHLTTLEKLELFDCYKLSILEIRYCENLTTILERIGNCNSLKVLEIVRCPKLTSLPEGMPKLEYLCIEECPTLIERCKEVEGEDWLKIKHIPHRIIK